MLSARILPPQLPRGKAAGGGDSRFRGNDGISRESRDFAGMTGSRGDDGISRE